MLMKLLFIIALIGVNNCLIVKNNEDLKNFYTIDNAEESSEQPLILRVRNNIQPNNLDYKIFVSKDATNNFDIAESQKYVIIKSKKQVVDVIPYNLIQRLDKIKYMVLWLNLYCEMHPDCDKTVLNEELKKVVSSVGESKNS